MLFPNSFDSVASVSRINMDMRSGAVARQDNTRAWCMVTIILVKFLDKRAILKVFQTVVGLVYTVLS